MDQKKRTVGLLGAISIGIGGMVGGGIFAVLGEAVSLARGATAVAFLFAGIVALLTAYSYSKLSVAYQNRGGTVVFVDNAFGHNLLSGSLNLLLWLSYLVTIALYAVAFASYAGTFFHGMPRWGKHVLSTAAILLPAVINMLRASFVSRSETAVVIIKLALLILVIVAGASFVDTARLSPAQWGSSFSIIVAGMIIFVAYEGFELIANASEDIRNPRSNLPRAFFGSTIAVVVLYALISVITVGTVPGGQLLASKDYALAVAAKPSLGQAGFTMVSITAMLATFSAINATIYGNARLGYIIAKEGELPALLDEERHDIPVAGVVLTSLLSMLIANLIDLAGIAIIGSAGVLLIFSLVNISAYRLRRGIGGNGAVLLAASVASIAALAALLIHTYADNPREISVFLSFIGISVLFETVYGRFYRGHFFHRRYGDS